jgi:hypothetical protein
MRIRGAVGSEKEDSVDLMIFCAMALVTLRCWTRVSLRRMVKARVRFTHGLSLRRLKKRL